MTIPDHVVSGASSWAVLEACGDSLTVLRAVREGDAIVDWVIVDANRLVQERWSWALGNVIGMRSSALNAAVDNRSFDDLYARALETGRRQEADLELRLPAGGDGWRRTIVVPIDADTVAVTTRDITRERYFESSLEQVRRTLRSLSNPSAEGPPSTTQEFMEARFFAGTAAVLFFAAGVITIFNSYMSRLPQADVPALRLTGLISILAAGLVMLLPWSRYGHRLGPCLAFGAVGFLVISDHFDHYSRTSAAVAQYPVFFIIIVAWSGFTSARGTATAVAVLSGLALAEILSSSGRPSIGWACAVVTMPASAVLGEVLSWAHRRVIHLTRLEAQRRLRDPLTGLANRQLFIERIDAALAGVRRHQLSAAVLFIDLDRFKQINDSLGHAVGDDVLVEAAARLSAAVRESDSVARFGGDEFAVLCDRIADPVEVTEIADRILTSISRPFTCQQRQVFLTASIGISFAAKGLETPDQLLQDADAAMYRAKDAGRAGYAVFDDSMQLLIARRLEMEGALRQAIGNEEMRVFFQPLVASDSGSVVGFEALLRWVRPGWGPVGPSEFIPIAEETGIVSELGAWVLREACLCAAEWAVKWPERRLGVSVNVSSRQLPGGEIVDVVRDALDRSELDPSLLTLELTETTLISDALSAQKALRSLRDLGVNIALDDFGTGYSSLTYLRTFPIDIIKIDRSFIRGLDQPEGTAIVAGIASLARNLRMSVVAEGIETPSQRAAATELGCDFLQGYLFARAVPPEEIHCLVERLPAPLALPGPDGVLIRSSPVGPRRGVRT